MNKVEEMLKILFNNDNISLGVHGTSMLPDKENNKAKEICETGLMCRYGDIRRTVALQDRGMIHAHGNIDFEHLVHYKFQKNTKGYTSKAVNEGKIIHFETEEIELEQCSFIIAIPKEMKTTDNELFCGDKRMFKQEYANDKEELRVGREKYGRPIDPKYIVGYYTNGDITTFKHNSRFYGFKEESKEGELPELDLEKIASVNEQKKKKNENEQSKSVEELGKETIEEQKNTKNKNKIAQFFKRQKQKIMQKNTGKERED